MTLVYNFTDFQSIQLKLTAKTIPTQFLKYFTIISLNIIRARTHSAKAVGGPHQEFQTSQRPPIYEHGCKNVCRNDESLNESMGEAPHREPFKSKKLQFPPKQHFKERKWPEQPPAVQTVKPFISNLTSLAHKHMSMVFIVK